MTKRKRDKYMYVCPGDRMTHSGQHSIKEKYRGEVTKEKTFKK